MEQISIIIPVYNVEQYLDDCVLSVQSQTWKNLEIILVDDGSTDSSGSRCDTYAAQDNRIKVIHQSNQGLSAARNAHVTVCNRISKRSRQDWHTFRRKDCMPPMSAC